MYACLIAACMLAASLAAYAREVEYPGPLVSMDWVEEHLDIIADPNQTLIRLVEVSKKGYEEAHIPGAVWVKWPEEVFEPATDHMVPSYDTIKAVLRKLGITRDTIIVIYGDSLTRAARFYWTLKYWGFEKVSLMNGTKQAWIEEGRPVTTEVPKVQPREVEPVFPPNSEILALLRPHVLYGLASGEVIFVDARPGVFAMGQEFQINKWIRSGRIPGAIVVAAPEEVTIDGKYLKSVEELRRIFEERGVTPDKEIIVYCNTGVRSSLAWFILSELLGYPRVRNYDGSMREYANLLYLPMEPDSFNVYEGFPKTPLQELREDLSALAESVEEVGRRVRAVSNDLHEVSSMINVALGVSAVAVIIALIGVALALRRRR